MLSGILLSPLPVSAAAKCMLCCQALHAASTKGLPHHRIGTAGLSYERAALLQHLQKNGEFDPVSCALSTVSLTVSVLAEPETLLCARRSRLKLVRRACCAAGHAAVLQQKSGGAPRGYMFTSKLSLHGLCC